MNKYYVGKLLLFIFICCYINLTTTLTNNSDYAHYCAIPMIIYFCQRTLMFKPVAIQHFFLLKSFKDEREIKEGSRAKVTCSPDLIFNCQSSNPHKVPLPLQLLFFYLSLLVISHLLTSVLHPSAINTSYFLDSELSSSLDLGLLSTIAITPA